MACDCPILAWRMAATHPSGKNMITFNPLKAMNPADSFELPCGQCMGCRLDKARQWGIRLHHETLFHERNCFLTLTYADKDLPEDGGLNLKDWQDFAHRYRKHCFRNEDGLKIRFFAAGEYGENTFRPHYHAIIFGHDFQDKKLWKKNAHGEDLYTSETLEKLWGKGYCTLGDVTFESASYVARYCTKKMTGPKAEEHYFRPHPVTGRFFKVKPDFAVMSRRPGLGQGYVEKYRPQFAPIAEHNGEKQMVRRRHTKNDFCVVKGVKMPIPAYYKKQLTEREQIMMKRIGRQAALPRKAENTIQRKQVKAEVRALNMARTKPKSPF